jgi:hypothetical protein
MAESGERGKHLGSGMLDDARKKITKRNKALREAAGDHNQPGTKFHGQRDGEDED